MKKKFIPMVALATIISCGMLTSVVSCKTTTPPVTETDKFEIVTSGELVTGTSVTLVLKKNGGPIASGITWTCVNGTGEASISGNKITATKAGEVTVKATYENKEVASTTLTFIASEEIVYDSIASVQDSDTMAYPGTDKTTATSTKTFKVKGTVVQKDSKGMVIYDETGYMPIYGNSFEYQVGSVISVEGTPSKYWANEKVPYYAQFDYKAQFTVLDEEGTLPTVTKMDFNAFRQYDSKTGTTAKYVEFIVKAAIDGSYTNLLVDGKLGEYGASRALSVNDSTIQFEDGTWYKVTGVLGYLNSGYYAKFYHTSYEKYTLPAPSSFTIATSKDTLKINETANLSAVFTPELSSGDVTYEITSGTDVVSLSGNTITGLKEGSAEIKGKIGELDSSNTLTINVTNDTLQTGPISIAQAIENAKQSSEGFDCEINAKIVAMSERCFILHDGTAATYFYKNKHGFDVNVGDIVNIKGNMFKTDYQPGYHFGFSLQDTDKGTLTVLKTAPEGNKFDQIPTDGETWDASKFNNYTGETTTLINLEAKLVEEGNNPKFEIEGVTKPMTFQYTKDSILFPECKVGLTFRTKAYIYDLNNGNLHFILASDTVDFDEAEAPTSITVTSEGDVTSIQAGNTLQFNATALPASSYQQVNWSTSDNSKATINDNGLLTAIAPTTEPIKVIATSTINETIKGEFSLTITEKEEITTVGSQKTSTFDKKFEGNETTYGELTWTLNGSVPGYLGFDAQNGKGAQFGSGGNPCKELVLSTTYAEGIKTLRINTSGASSIEATLTVTVGGEKMLVNGDDHIVLTKDATDYTFTSEKILSGTVVLTFTQTSSKAIYIKEVVINPTSTPTTK